MNDKSSKRLVGILFLIGLFLAGSGCSRSIVVTVPPRVDLAAFQTIGVIDFSVTGSQPLGQQATQSFLQQLQAAQPGVRVLELGPAEKFSRELLDPAGLRAIGEKYGVDALLTGQLQVSEVKPDLRLSSAWNSLNANAYVNGALNAKLRETGRGATLWTNSVHGKWSVANINLAANGPASFGLSNPEEKYGKMVAELSHALCADFRPTYERRRISD
ncbi:hypothetical protein DESUT3_07190 [Desulfuromonas versatilis]|uniref:Lipoprotein n=1 Tax=Desulfuromonas versatilis TaxID=2802975 RepID=A0ABM8HPQ4_9BACT|nr:hypothetical protein [Desulfuromonas versatilis]BCR03650.1 hypothetical protein DESUT3_07190 [Desulfuromonas versatilis]